MPTNSRSLTEDQCRYPWFVDTLKAFEVAFMRVLTQNVSETLNRPGGKMKRISNRLAHWVLIAVFAAVITPNEAMAQSRVVERVGAEDYAFFGAGYSDVLDKSGDPSGVVLVEVGFRELIGFQSSGHGTVFRIRPRIAVESTFDGDFYGGIGLSGEVFPFGGPMFIEGSFLPGVQHRPERDENYPIQFRSQLGLGYLFENGRTLAVTFDHKSNNGWGDGNSATETLMVRYGAPFSSLYKERSASLK